MRIVTKEGLRELLSATPIAALAAERGLCPKPVGGIHIARCPFDGGSEGLRLYDDTGRFRCFMCGESGNTFGLVATLDGLTFLETLTLLADRGGLDLDQVMSNRSGPPRSSVPVWALTPPAATW